MGVVRAEVCECGHTRRQHWPKGCLECECVERAPNFMVREDGSEHESWGMERVPFEPGNTAALRHGERSRGQVESLVSEEAQRVLAELMAVWPWLADADAVTVDILCKAKARFDRIDRYVNAVIDGEITAYPRKGKPTTGIEAVADYLWQALARHERTVIDSASKLGLNPVDRAALFKDTGMAQHYGREGVEKMIGRGSARLRQIRKGS